MLTSVDTTKKTVEELVGVPGVLQPMKVIGGHKFALKGDRRPRVEKRMAVVPVIDRAEEKRREEERLFGRMGPASPVRKIDPATGQVVAVLPAHSGPLIRKQASTPTGHK